MKYYNQTVVTLDVDWATDYQMEVCLELFEKYGVKSTWFCTHPSVFVEKIQRHPLVEIGFHPNYLMGSSHGNNLDEVFKYMNTYFPDVKSVRSHGVHISGEILFRYAKYTKISIDSSFFLPEMSNITPVKQLFPEGHIWKIPFFWSDDYQLVRNDKEEGIFDINKFSDVAGLKVMNFHPIHVANNSFSYSKYIADKELVSENLSLNSIGTKSYFTDLLKNLENSQTYTLNDVLNEWVSK